MSLKNTLINLLSRLSEAKQFSRDVGRSVTHWFLCCGRFLFSHQGVTTPRGTVNTLRPRQNGRHFSDDIFICIFLNENVWISIKNSLKFVPRVRINNIPALVQIMAWRWPGDKPLSEPMMVRFPAHICITWPQWVNMVFNLVWKIPPLTLKQLGYVFLNIISFSNIVPSKCNISIWTAPIQWMFNQHSGYWWPGFSPRASVAIVMGTHPWVCSTWYIPNLWVKSLRPCGAYMHR